MAITKSNERTKYELADAMKRCMKTAPVEKITVKEIVEACGVTRQTFYRNFQDKSTGILTKFCWSPLNIWERENLSMKVL